MRPSLRIPSNLDGEIPRYIEPPGRARRCLLQQARDVRAVDQGRQGRDQVDAAVVPDVWRKRGAAPQGTVTVSAIIQSDELGRLEIGVRVLNQGNEKLTESVARGQDLVQQRET